MHRFIPQIRGLFPGRRQVLVPPQLGMAVLGARPRFFPGTAGLSIEQKRFFPLLPLPQSPAVLLPSDFARNERAGMSFPFCP